MQRIAIIDKNGSVVNISVWDGVTPWDPSTVFPDCTLVNADDFPGIDIATHEKPSTVDLVGKDHLVVPIIKPTAFEAVVGVEVVE